MHLHYPVRGAGVQAGVVLQLLLVDAYCVHDVLQSGGVRDRLAPPQADDVLYAARSKHRQRRMRLHAVHDILVRL